MGILSASKVGVLPRLSSARSMTWWWGPERCNGREVVGTTIHGDEQYQDRYDYWYPAIRFRKNDEVITPIRHKELGDWKKLSVDEMKLLYRYSFRQTLAEFEAPQPYAPLMLSGVFAVVACGILYFSFIRKYVIKVDDRLPDTFDEEFKESQVERRLVLERGNPYGPAHYYDYEKNRWKD
uniref:Cytochrome c oxidase subunit 4 n=1 Tax=Globodera rostochiensis TaxID=31243 RepID=A0A914I626_GLORO